MTSFLLWMRLAFMIRCECLLCSGFLLVDLLPTLPFPCTDSLSIHNQLTPRTHNTHKH